MDRVADPAEHRPLLAQRPQVRAAADQQPGEPRSRSSLKRPDMGSIAVPGLTGLGNGTLPSTNDVKFDTYSDDLAWTKGKHFLKTGVLIEHAFSSKQTTTNSRGGYSFSSMANFFAGIPTGSSASCRARICSGSGRTHCSASTCRTTSTSNPTSP